jgi:hypothetical protein
MHIFRTLYFIDFFNSTQFFLTHPTFQAHLNVEPWYLGDWNSQQIYSEININDWLCDAQVQLPARVMMEEVIYECDQNLLTNISGKKHARQLYLRIGNIQTYIRHTPNVFAWILIALMYVP